MKPQTWVKSYETLNLPLALLFEQRNYGRRRRPDIEGKQNKTPRLETPLGTLQRLGVPFQLLMGLLQLRRKPLRKSQRYSTLIHTRYMLSEIMLPPYGSMEQQIPTQLNQFVSSFLLDDLQLISYQHRESSNTGPQRAGISEPQKRATNSNSPRLNAGSLAYDVFVLDLQPKAKKEIPTSRIWSHMTHLSTITLGFLRTFRSI